MNVLNMAVILGSTRPGRKGEAVAEWVVEHARGRSAAYELVDLKDHPMPHYNEQFPPSLGKHDTPPPWSGPLPWRATTATCL